MWREVTFLTCIYSSWHSPEIFRTETSFADQYKLSMKIIVILIFITKLMMKFQQKNTLNISLLMFGKVYKVRKSTVWDDSLSSKTKNTRKPGMCIFLYKCDALYIRCLSFSCHFHVILMWLKSFQFTCISDKNNASMIINYCCLEVVWITCCTVCMHSSPEACFLQHFVMRWMCPYTGSVNAISALFKSLYCPPSY